MSTATVSSADLDVFTDAPAPAPRRPRLVLIGASLVAGAATAAIGGMLALYTQARGETVAEGGTWLPEGTVLELPPGNMALLSLSMSAITALWAVYALRNHDRSHAFFALGLTLLFGVAFIVDTVYLWQQLNIGISDSAQAVLIYTITAAHVAMVAGGLLFLLVTGFQALGGQLTTRVIEGLQAAVLFWFVTIGVYAVVWYTIYVTK